MGQIQNELQKALIKIDAFTPSSEAEEKDRAEIANELTMMIGFIGNKPEENLPENFLSACDDLLGAINSL